MGMEGLEPSTLRLSGVYSKPLSYMPLKSKIHEKKGLPFALFKKKVLKR